MSTQKILFCILAIFEYGLADAKTITAVTGKASDVQAAINSASACDIVVIPAGTFTWTSEVLWEAPANVILQGAGSQSTLGGGDATIIVDSIDRTGPSGDIAALEINPSNSGEFRLTGITFRSGTDGKCLTYNGSVRFDGTSNAVRVDHCHFNKINLVDLDFQGWIYGVVDHCLFTAGYDDENQTRVGDGSWNGDMLGLGDESWADSSYFGSDKFVFFEDNDYESPIPGVHAFAFDHGNNGSRLVFRHNTMGYHTALQTHAEAGDRRPCRAIEIYDNTMTWSSDPVNDQFFALIMLEAGTGVAWGNTITGFNTFIDADVVRANNVTYPQSAPPNGWGYAGTTLGPSTWDGNTDSTGYPSIDQIGRGKGDLLTGLFPNKVDKVTSTITWPRQMLDPWYVWANTFNPVPQEPVNYWSNFDPGVTVENRDYFLELPNYNENITFNGTAGVGQGLLSARPSACTTNVGYWATDKQTLYQCVSKNTWAAHYTPYAYPHPLVNGTNNCNPTATSPDLNSDQQIKIYPNPAQSKIYFAIKGVIATVNVRVYTVDGQLVAMQNLTMQTERTMDVSGLAPGIYFVQIVNDTISSTQKVVITE